jgi:lipopolysaccharide/colanic/teichoic acid biosynthesis glycosyltransferase
MMIADTKLPSDFRVWRTDAGHLRSLDVHRLPIYTWYPPLKAAAEFTAAALLLIILAPIIGLAALLVKCTSRGPAFYSQVRLGKHGRPFSIFKLRSMTHECERVSGPQWSQHHDPRVTAIGRVLRRTHIDELPQLWNVLRGEMALIGPRPERPEFVPKLESAIPHYRHRLLVRPGASGLAQVQLPPDVDLASVRRKLAYDLYYVRHMNPWMDVRLTLCTAFHLLGVPFHHLRRLFRLPCVNTVEHAYASPALPPLALPRIQSA